MDAGEAAGSKLEKKNTLQATQFSHLRDDIAIGPSVVVRAVEAVVGVHTVTANQENKTVSAGCNM